jgi:hypothetical protein
MKTLQDLQNAKNKKGLTKTVSINSDLKKLVDSLELTQENNQYATPIFNDDTLIKYEPATTEKPEGVRVINYSATWNKNTHRIYRKPININFVKKELSLTQNKIAEMFGYKDGGSYARSTRKKHIDNGICEIYNLMKNKDL